MNTTPNTAFTAFCEVCYLLFLEQFSKLSQYIDFISNVDPKLLYKNIIFFSGDIIVRTHGLYKFYYEKFSRFFL